MKFEVSLHVQILRSEFLKQPKITRKQIGRVAQEKVSASVNKSPKLIQSSGFENDFWDLSLNSSLFQTQNLNLLLKKALPTALRRFAQPIYLTGFSVDGQ